MLVGLVGFIGAGKNSVASGLVNDHGFEADSFARTLKDVVSVVFGWDRGLIEGDTNDGRLFRERVDYWWEEELKIPGFTPRMALQLIGTDVMRECFNSDIWVLTLRRRLGVKKNIVVTDARFKNEIDVLRNAGGIIIRIKRGPEPEWYDIAVAANGGCEESKKIMEEKYSDVHRSEWGWVGNHVDYTIENDSTVEHLRDVLEKVLELGNKLGS